MAVRSPLASAESGPSYAQLAYWEKDHPWLPVVSASTPMVNPRGSPSLDKCANPLRDVLQLFPDQRKAQRNVGSDCAPR